MKNLDHLLQLPNPWHGGAFAEPPQGVPTGFAELDGLLPERGWVQSGLTELLIPRDGAGALQLILPILARLSRRPRWIAWVAPPYLPYAPALHAAGVDLSRLVRVYPRPGQDGLATVEACLRAGTCSAVLAWPVAGELQGLRRLHRAAMHGNAWGVLFRPDHFATSASPAAQRVQVAAAADGIELTRFDERGACGSEQVELPFERLLQPLSAPRLC